MSKIYKGSAWQVDGIDNADTSMGQTPHQDERPSLASSMNLIARLHRDAVMRTNKYMEENKRENANEDDFSSHSDEDSHSNPQGRESASSARSVKKERKSGRLDPFNLYSWGTKDILQIEAEWAHRLKCLREEKDAEIERLQKALAGRDAVICDMEDTAQQHLDTIKNLRSELDSRTEATARAKLDQLYKHNRLGSSSNRQSSTKSQRSSSEKIHRPNTRSRRSSWVDCPTLDQ